MAAPVAVDLTCPLCQSVFRARTMGSSYYISGTDTDLRETGSIEEVRRYSVATCPCCLLSDYSWNFQDYEELAPDERDALAAALEFDPREKVKRELVPGDFERFRLAARCFGAREFDQSSLAELALLAYYVARDLGRRDLEPGLRDEAAGLFAKALEEDELPAPLRLRYAYLAGELSRRAGRRDDALRWFDEAVQAAREAGEEGDPDGHAAFIGQLARRMQTRALYRDAAAAELLELTRDEDPEVAAEARRILAGRRDRASVEASVEAWRAASPRERTGMLREMVQDPALGLYDLFVEALGSTAPEDIRSAARALRELGDPRAAEPLLACLERGVLSTEAALVDALRHIEAPGRVEGVRRVLERWEAQAAPSGDPEADAWRFTPDPVPLRNLLYTEGGAHGLELLIRDMQHLVENDLWDKVPSGGPVSAALALSTPEVAIALRGLLSSQNPATRRWSAFCLAEMGVTDAAEDIAALVKDEDAVVRLQAASSLARLSDSSQDTAAAALRELKALPAEDVPFALHFLIPFQSKAVKGYLLELLEGGAATPGEVLPLLGRQEPDERTRSTLTQALLDTNDDTRAGAVTGLAYQGGADAVEKLRLLYDPEESDEVRRRIVFGLGRLASQGHEREGTVAFLRRRLGRGNPRLRFSIALTLLQLGDPTGIDIVRDRAALFEESFDRYDLVAPALKALAAWDRGRVVQKRRRTARFVRPI